MGRRSMHIYDPDSDTFTIPIINTLPDAYGLLIPYKDQLFILKGGSCYLYEDNAEPIRL